MTQDYPPVQRGSQHEGGNGEDGVPQAPPELVERHRKTQSARVAAGQTIAKTRQRRRIVPPLAVGSVVLVGSGLAATFVDRTLPTAAVTPSASTSPAPATAPSTSVANAYASTLARVREALHADKEALLSIGKAAAAAAKDNSASSTTVEQAPAGGGASGGGAAAAPTYAGTGASAGSGASLPGLPALPPLPAMPAMPTVNIPSTPVHATTGASHVVP